MRFLRMSRFPYRNRYKEDNATEEENNLAIKMFSCIAIFLIFIFAIISLANFFKTGIVSVDSFSVSEDGKQISIVIDAKDETQKELSAKLVPNKQNEYVYVKVYRDDKNNIFSTSSTITVPVNENSEYVGISLDNEPYTLVAIKDKNTGEWRTPSWKEKIKYDFKHLWKV